MTFFAGLIGMIDPARKEVPAAVRECKSAGINDAPALKKADIGIAMGLRGNQVAQDVADMVLKDDSFASIVVAIKQGRVIFENIRKFIIFLLSYNVSELLLIGFTSIFNIHYALFPLQILFINLVTDVLPALALGVTEGSDDIMIRKPRNSSEPIIDQTHWRALVVYSIVMSITSIAAVYDTLWCTLGGGLESRPVQQYFVHDIDLLTNFSCV